MLRTDRVASTVWPAYWQSPRSSFWPRQRPVEIGAWWGPSPMRAINLKSLVATSQPVAHGRYFIQRCRTSLWNPMPSHCCSALVPIGRKKKEKKGWTDWFCRFRLRPQEAHLMFVLSTLIVKVLLQRPISGWSFCLFLFQVSISFCKWLKVV